ncbi:MAG: hypothetical protein K2P78_14525 [Gemmataceae bacterium]|nr:hypothetical protein [Gemmataceae bacterium]
MSTEKLTARLTAHTDTNIRVEVGELRPLCETIPSDPIAAGLLRVLDGKPNSPAKDGYNPLAPVILPTRHLSYLIEQQPKAADQKPAASES